MKRVVLFIVTNLAVMLVLGIAARLLGVNRFLTANGLNLGTAGLRADHGLRRRDHLAADEQADGQVEHRRQMSSTTQRPDAPLDRRHRAALSERAGIGMPEVALYEGEPNAFATGAFKNSALVAVSTGLLHTMNRDEVEAVIGHEVAHVANGDMVTMTLIQG
jgi:heat shock protein HtpX